MAEDDAQSRRGSSAGFPRRVLLGGLGTAAAATAAVSAFADREEHRGDRGSGGPETVPEGAAPDGAARDALQHLNPHQALTVEAIAARIIPGDEENPGAREAGVVFYIDHLLASHTGYPEPAYMQAPFAQTYEGDTPPEPDGEVVWVHADELERYGRQSAFVPREMYRMGLARLDALCRRRFNSDFVEIEDGQQDELLAEVEDAEADDVSEIFGELAADQFFQTVRTHILQGFFADPVYGGNRDMVGWRLIGFPGSRRSYSIRDIFDENYDVTPQSMLDLPPFNADHGQAHDHGGPTVRRRHPNGPID